MACLSFTLAIELTGAQDSSYTQTAHTCLYGVCKDCQGCLGVSHGVGLSIILHVLVGEFVSVKQLKAALQNRYDRAHKQVCVLDGRICARPCHLHDHARSFEVCLEQ